MRWTQEESGRVHTPLEPVVLAATLALVPVLIIETDATSEGWQQFALVANWIIWAFFAAELAVVLVVAGRKRAALRAHWLDVAIVVLTIPLLGQALAWLRLARFIRLARFAVLVTRAVQAEKRVGSGDSLRIAVLLTVTSIFVAGFAEHATGTDDFESLWDGIWWAIVTVTTVGYGDVYPTTVQGRLIGVVLMFVGIGFLSLLTAAIASRFVKQERSEEREEAELQRQEMMETLRRIEADVCGVEGTSEQRLTRLAELALGAPGRRRWPGRARPRRRSDRRASHARRQPARGRTRCTSDVRPDGASPRRETRASSPGGAASQRSETG
jgi:voltage-gated potassium channel